MATHADKSPPAQTVTLEAFEVHGAAICDFGMSVRTNSEVRWGAHVEWMRVSAVSPSRSAATHGLAVGDQILAMDGREITAFDRDEMLATLFQRKKGDRCRLLILGEQQSLPHFVTLTADRDGR